MSEMKLLFAGDIYLPDALDAPIVAASLGEALAAYPCRVCNFEAPAWHEGARFAPKAGPALLQGPDTAARVLEAGFTHVSLCNNHSLDCGEAGLEASLRAFPGAAVFGAGFSQEDAFAPAVVEQNGLTAAVLAGCERQAGALLPGQSQGYAWLEDPAFEDRLRQAKREYDFAVVFAHGGLERESVPLPYWRARYKRLIQCGADAVIASHPHTVQGAERTDGGVILYSLGDFLWGERPSLSILAGLTLTKGAPPALTRIPVRAQGGAAAADASPEREGELARLDALLKDEAAYDEAVKGMVGRWGKSFGLDYLRGAVGYVPGGPLTTIKNTVKRLLRWRGGERADPLALEAVLGNETIREALLLLIQQKQL